MSHGCLHCQCGMHLAHKSDFERPDAPGEGSWVICPQCITPHIRHDDDLVRASVEEIARAKQEPLMWQAIVQAIVQSKIQNAQITLRIMELQRREAEEGESGEPERVDVHVYTVDPAALAEDLRSRSRSEKPRVRVPALREAVPPPSRPNRLPSGAWLH